MPDPETPPSPFYLVGPTGTGKSAIACELARRWDGEIVNADAYQLYEGFRIITARPAASELARAPHHLYGVLPLAENFSAAAFRELAQPVIDATRSRNRRPIVVGGSGLYIKALTHGLADLPPREPALRKALGDLPWPRRVAWLREIDPEGAAAMNLENPRYVTRALEISLLAGQPASRLKASWKSDPEQIAPPVGVVLTRAREDLYARIDARAERMLREGAADEIRNLPDEPGETACKAIGFREIRLLLHGEITETECAARIAQASRRYAKRQTTWFKRETCFESLALAPDEDPVSSAQRIADRWPG